MINKCFSNLSRAINFICNENTNSSEKSRVQHVLRHIEGDYIPIYIVRFEKTVSLISNYNVAVFLGDTANATVYRVWYDSIGNWHVIQQ